MTIFVADLDISDSKSVFKYHLMNVLIIFWLCRHSILLHGYFLGIWL